MEATALASAMVRPMAAQLNVPDLIRAVEVLRQSGQTSVAIALYAQWITDHPTEPLLYAVLFNYGVMLTDAGHLELARLCLERAIALNPDFMPAYINVGRVYERMGNVGLALTHWSAALGRMASINGLALTHKTTALNQSARALEAANQDEAAEQMLQHSVELDSNQREAIAHLIALRQRQCEWPVIQVSERVSHATLMRGISPLSIAAHSDDPLLHLALAHHYNKLDVGDPEETVPLKVPPVSALAASGAPRLRIGYLSSDLREHAVGYLMTEVLGLHDRSRVEVFAYYCGPEAKDPLHQHFQATADHFVNLTELDDVAAARRIAADGIHILVDLNGYTREARLKVVAQRPAPVIVNWLGFPGSMASPYHQYLIADDFIIPESHERYYSEKVLRLPCYQPSSRQRQIAARPTRSAAGLPEDATVFCCFNGSHKIHPQTFERWLAILQRVPNGVLWLLGSTPAANERLRDQAAMRGVARERLVFADKLANSHHLARYPLADVFLDTSPYGAHTTASDALWMGVPVVTVSGQSFAARVCASLVRAAGIPELVCETTEQYVDVAVRLAEDSAWRAELQRRLTDGRETCTLFDMPNLVRHLEDLFDQMWADQRSGTLPSIDLKNLDVYLELGCDARHATPDVQGAEHYLAYWQERARSRHRHRPIEADTRLVTPALLAEWSS